MRIALIASRLRTGGGRVVVEKTAEQLALLCPDAELLIVRPRGISYAYGGHPSVQELECPQQSLVGQYFWDRNVLQPALRRFQPDWVWSLANYPVAGQWRQSLLIHDPHLTFPQSFFKDDTLENKTKKWLGRRMLRSRIHLPRRFYCQTTAIRSSACEQLGISPEKVGLYPPGTEEQGFVDTTASAQREASPAVKAVANAADKFVLFYPARGYKHKNHRVIVEAYSRFRDELANTRCFLTISPSDHATAAQAIRRIESEKLDSVDNLGPLRREEVVAIFGMSDALLMPTKLETFGIPFVEAMQSHTPIITSNYDFVRAVCQDAAEYIDDADDPRQVKDAILALATNQERCQQLAERGFTIAQSLPTWADAVRGVLMDEGIPCLCAEGY
jgi:glycosyltransferase involved in cell wall biosynthesis